MSDCAVGGGRRPSLQAIKSDYFSTWRLELAMDIAYIGSLKKWTGQEVLWNVTVCFKDEEGFSSFPDLHIERD